MQDDIYYLDPVARTLQLLKDTFGDKFKAYYNGDAEPGESFLPCIMVSSQAATVRAGATGNDNINESVMIILSLNRKDDIGAGPEDETTEFRIRKLVMGQDPESLEWLPQTVMYAVRKHLTMSGDVMLDNNVTIDFAPNVRAGSIPTQEAYITVEVTRLARVPSRD